MANARTKTVPDVIAKDLDVLFCGINPGLYSGAMGQHFARPGNRFWKALHLAGFTKEQLEPWQRRELLACGLGITNLVPRTTATASELSAEELRRGRVLLERKLRRYRPRALAVLGVGAYRQAFERPAAVLGRQPEKAADSELWVLPNPSGLNAHYQLAQLAELFRQFRLSLSSRSRTGRSRP